MNNFIKQGFLVIAAASLFSPVKPAVAASNTCWMVTEPWKCTTNSVSANAQAHFVHIDISPRVEYVVVDSNNGVVVNSGTSGWTGTRKTIIGLYSRYHIKAKAVGPFRAFATISNN
jgi:hypothetical protein